MRPGRPRLLPGAERVLAVHEPALPQPDQLCGPFSARVALAAVLDEPPSVADLALAAGTTVWPHDLPEARPPGAPVDRTGWERLPRAGSPEASGTDAAGLARAIEALTPGRVVPVRGVGRSGLAELLDAVAASPAPVGVLANLRTGPIAPPSAPEWDVGHFVVLWGWDAERREVGVADTYRQVGEPPLPPGCRTVELEALAAALPGRGLLLLTGPGEEATLEGIARRAGATLGLWTT